MMDLTAYEKERLKNIERNKTLLANLGINKKLTENFDSLSTPKNKTKPLKRNKSDDILTTKRASSRLAQIDRPSYNYDEIQKQQTHLAKIMAKEEQKAKRELRRRQSEAWIRPIGRYKREERSLSEDETTSEDDNDDERDNSNVRRSSSRLKKKVTLKSSNIVSNFSQKRIDYSIFEKNLNISGLRNISGLQHYGDTKFDIFSINESKYTEPVVMFTGITTSYLYHSVNNFATLLILLDCAQARRHCRRE